jgi:hypothetical protein
MAASGETLGVDENNFEGFRFYLNLAQGVLN